MDNNSIVSRSGHGWHGPVLEKSEGHLQRLDPATIARLGKRLPDAWEVPLTEDSIADFTDQASAWFGAIGSDLEERLRIGPGISILTGDGLAELSDGQLAVFLYGLSLLIGQPIAQNSDAERIVSIQVEPAGEKHATRGYRTNSRMRMHTDATDVAGLMCLRQGASGGENMFCSASVVHDILAEEIPDDLHEYYRPWDWELANLATPTLLSPIYSYYAGRLSCRYGSSMLRNGAGRAGRQLTERQVSVLDRFEEVAHRPELVLRYSLSRGESVWVDNYRVLHGREAFQDGDVAGEARCLLRTWVSLHESPALAPGFASFNEVIHAGWTR